MAPDLVLFGNLIVDDVVFADGTTHLGEPGGAILYAALAGALAGLRVGVCAPCGSDYPRAMLDRLAARGVDLSGLRPLGRRGLRTWLLYEPAARRVVHRLGSPTHEQASPAPADLPAGWRGARAFHIAPIPLDRQRALVAGLPDGDAWRSLDPHEPIGEENLERWREVLEGIDLLFLSEEELQLAGTEPRHRLARLAGGRLALVALKRGPLGGWLYDLRADRLREWRPRALAVVDPTGAGDAFASGVLAALLAAGAAPGRAPGDEVLGSALELGAVLASFALEAWGAAALADATPEAVRERLERRSGTGARA